MSRQLFISFVRRAVGSVFAVSGLSKLFAFAPFAESVARLTGLPPWSVPLLAWLVIGLEMFVGVSLIAGWRTRQACSVTLVLLCSFILFLSLAVLRGEAGQCNCFGNMLPYLQPRWEVLIDLVLLCAVVFIVTTGNPKRRHVLLIAASSGSVLWCFLNILQVNADPAAEKIQREALISPILRNRTSGVGWSVILLTNFDDFSCQLCLDDFLSFCDSLSGLHSRQGIQVQLLVKRDRRKPNVQAHRLGGWAKGNGFTFPVIVDQDSTFERSGVRRSTVVCLDQHRNLMVKATFPLGDAKRSEILRRLSSGTL